MFAPSGFITVEDAINIVGRDVFEEKWTGRESSARSGLITVERYEMEKAQPVMSGSGAGGPRRAWQIEADPLKRYPYGDPHSDEYKAELEARERWVAARVELRKRLEATSTISSALDPETGAMKSIDPAMWRRSNALHFLESGSVPMYSHGKGVVFIVDRRQDADKARDAVPIYKTGLPGQPTSKHLFEAEFIRRKQSGLQLGSLKSEAIYLAQWLKDTHPHAAPATPKTIENNLRGIYRTP